MPFIAFLPRELLLMPKITHETSTSFDFEFNWLCIYLVVLFVYIDNFDAV